MLDYMHSMSLILLLLNQSLVCCIYFSIGTTKKGIGPAYSSKVSLMKQNVVLGTKYSKFLFVGVNLIKLNKVIK